MDTNTRKHGRKRLQTRPKVSTKKFQSQNHLQSKSRKLHATSAKSPICNSNSNAFTPAYNSNIVTIRNTLSNTVTNSLDNSTINNLEIKCSKSSNFNNQNLQPIMADTVNIEDEKLPVNLLVNQHQKSPLQPKKFYKKTSTPNKSVQLAVGVNFNTDQHLTTTNNFTLSSSEQISPVSTEKSTTKKRDIRTMSMLVLDWIRQKGNVKKDQNLEPFENLPKCRFNFSVSEWAKEYGENNESDQKEQRRRFYEIVNVLEGLNLVRKSKQLEIDNQCKSHTWIGLTLDETIDEIWQHDKSSQNKKKVLSKEEANRYELIRQHQTIISITRYFITQLFANKLELKRSFLMEKLNIKDDGKSPEFRILANVKNVLKHFNLIKQDNISKTKLNKKDHNYIWIYKREQWLSRINSIDQMYKSNIPPKTPNYDDSGFDISEQVKNEKVEHCLQKRPILYNCDNRLETLAIVSEISPQKEMNEDKENAKPENCLLSSSAHSNRSSDSNGSNFSYFDKNAILQHTPASQNKILAQNSPVIFHASDSIDEKVKKLDAYIKYRTKNVSPLEYSPITKSELKDLVNMNSRTLKKLLYLRITNLENNINQFGLDKTLNVKKNLNYG